MIIDQLNLNHLRIFESIFRTRSVTAAAKELHLTQSGASQHLKAFEEMLGVKLFDRIKQRIVPTPSAHRLYEKCARSLGDIERALTDIKRQGDQIAGPVSIGMPLEFGNNVVIPLIPEFAKDHPLVTYGLKLGFAGEMNERLLDGELDFALVDTFNMDRRVETQRVYDEILDLCVSADLMKRLGKEKNERKYFESLEYIEYERDEAILRMWFGHHLGTRNLNLNVRATVMDVQSVARMIGLGLGAGILPHHLTLKLQKEGHEIVTFRGCGTALKNSISLAYLRDRTQTPASLAMMEWLKGELLKGKYPLT
jgi:DNA-binding transcriptional LysR family regulator